MTENRNVALAMLEDLMFQVKIAEAARRATFTTVFVTSGTKFWESMESFKPCAIVLDINLASADPLAIIKSLKAAAPTRSIPIIGYISHVQVELRAEAAQAGCDVVLPRSTVIQKLPELLAGYASPRT